MSDAVSHAMRSMQHEPAAGVRDVAKPSKPEPPDDEEALYNNLTVAKDDLVRLYRERGAVRAKIIEAEKELKGINDQIESAKQRTDAACKALDLKLWRF